MIYVPRKGAVYRLDSRYGVEGTHATAYLDRGMCESSFDVPWGSPVLVLDVEVNNPRFDSGCYVARVLTSYGVGWLYDIWLQHCIVEPTSCAQ